MPTDRLDVLKAAMPALSVAVPKVVEPSGNVTVPVAADGVTTAVNVTAVPEGTGFVDDETVTAEACFTVCVSLEDVLVL